jgi:hypothetical protein
LYNWSVFFREISCPYKDCKKEKKNDVYRLIISKEHMELFYFLLVFVIRKEEKVDELFNLSFSLSLSLSPTLDHLHTKY